MEYRQRTLSDDSVQDFDFLEECENKRLEFISQGVEPNEANDLSLEYGKERLKEQNEINDDDIEEIAEEAQNLEVEELKTLQLEYFRAICNLMKPTKFLTPNETRLCAATIDAPIVPFDVWIERTK